MTAKDPRFVESGRAGARKRWGAPRIVRLDHLTADEREVVIGLIEAKRIADAMKAGATPAPGHE